MNPRSILLALALVAAPVLAGCVSPGGLLTPQATLPDLQLPAQLDSLWPDHQNEPHPAYGWPTLTHPATGANVPSWWAPIPMGEMPATIKGLATVAKTPEGVKAGAGIALFGSIALVPTYGKDNHVVDISDPTSPKLLGSYEGGERGAAIMAFPDGRLFGVVSSNKGFDIVDITDPTMPEIIANVSPKTGGHKVGVVPGTPIVYNANSAGGSENFFLPTANLPSQAKGQTEIYDLSDPANPVLVQEFKNGYGCHHIFFWVNAEKQRAICAGIEMTQIWDIADPLAPKVIVNIPVHHGVTSAPGGSIPIVMFSHFAILNEKGNILVVGDEFMGGGPAECDGVRTPAKDVSGPLGNLWFYDVKDEKNPKLLGWISPPPQTVTDPSVPKPTTDPFELVFGELQGCTAHHGRLVPDPEGKRDLLAMAWYGAGVVLIDFTDAANPKIVDQWNPGTNTWEVWYYNGYLFTGDLARGMDVLKFK